MAAELFYLVAVAALVAALVRAWRLRTARNRSAGGAHVLLLVALGVTFAVMATPSQAWVNRWVPDLFKLVGNCGSAVAVFSAQALMLFTAYSRAEAVARLRLRLAGLLVVVAVLVVAFFWPHPVPLTGSFDASLAVDPALAVYTVVYAVWLGVGTADVTGLVWRFSAHTTRYLRAGLRLIALSGVVGVAYAAAKIAIVVQHVVTGSRQGAGDQAGVCHAAFDSPACAVAVGIPTVAVLGLVVGVLLASAAARLEGVHRWVGQHRAYRQLAPLWRHLYEAMPEIARLVGEDQPGWPRDIGWRLTRRLVQVRDGLLLLAPYRDPAVGREAWAAAERAGLSGLDRDAVVEAAHLTAALHAHRTGRPAPTEAPDPPPGPHADFDAETAWLRKVSRALTHSAVAAAYDHPRPARETGDRPT